MKKKVISICSVVCLASAVFLLNSCNIFQKPDLNKMKEAYKNYLIENTNVSKFEKKSIDEINANLEWKEISGTNTCFFKDINYKKDDERAEWPASNHVINNLTLAILYEKTGNDEYKDISLALTYFWVYNNFRNTNWYHNDLNARAYLSSIALFNYEDLNDKGKAALMGQIHDASFTYHKGLDNHNGANLFDYADITLKVAMLENNADEFNDAFNAIKKEISVDTIEGFQTDGSFFQHGKQIQIASYGKCVSRLGKMLKIINAGNIEFPIEKLNIIKNYILRGLRYTTHKGYSNYTCVGREYTRGNNALYINNNNYKQFSFYSDVQNFPDKEQLNQFIENCNNKESTFEGMEFFDKAKLITLNLDGLYMSYKGTDDDIINTECVNDENQLGLNLSYGTNTAVMDNGEEYNNISALWRYDYLPGTTSYNLDPGQEDEQIIKIAQDSTLYNDSLFEVSLPKDDGSNKYVYNAQEDTNNKVDCLMEKTTHHKENNLTVTCFACEDGMVLVGSGLDYTGEITGNGRFFSSPRSLHTTLEQCMYKGSHSLSDDKKQLTHGNAVYKILDDNLINVEVEQRTGVYQRNNPQLTKDNNPITGTTLLAYINYPTNFGNKYAYSIQPLSKQDKNFEIIDTGSDLIHAVKLPNEKIAVAFYTDDKFEYNNITYEGSCGEFKVF